ncbi:MAG: sulfotransferase domain-containing protein [Actinomycetota bacterium]|nr:sulfotransferase domain-containing protein [Actinomycetota bacterium]
MAARPPTAAKPRRNLRTSLDYTMRNRLPQPAYQTAVRSYYEARKLIGKGFGHGRLLPDFVIIGAAKAGTTSLYAWLGQHPFVARASQKEVHYFDYNHYRGEDWYRRHFPLASERDLFTARHGRPFITGEASPSYVSHEWAPQRLAGLLPDAKIIVALREPVDRAYSHFQMSRREEEEPFDSFEAAVAAEEQRLAPELARSKADPRYRSWPIGCWSYLMRSSYAEQLERWFALLPREQFHILTLEDLSAQPQETLDQVHEFLELPPHVYEGLKPLHTATYDPIDRATRAQLADYFRPMNERLYELLGRDLGWERPAGANSARQDRAEAQPR